MPRPHDLPFKVVPRFEIVRPANSEASGSAAAGAGLPKSVNESILEYGDVRKMDAARTQLDEEEHIDDL